MKAVQDDLAFTLTCGEKAYETLFVEAANLGLVDPSKCKPVLRPLG
jgi:hypothetical protein